MRATLDFINNKTNEHELSGISQKELVGSHIKCFANDFCGIDGSDKFYLLAPFDCIVKAIATGDNTTFFESIDKVQMPIGNDYAFIMATHINDVDRDSLGLKVGKTYKKGEKIYCEGVKGIGSGYHMHIEVGTGRYNGSGSPYSWKGKYFTWNGTTYKLYEPNTSGVERHINEIFYLANSKDRGNIKNFILGKWIMTFHNLLREMKTKIKLRLSVIY